MRLLTFASCSVLLALATGCARSQPAATSHDTKSANLSLQRRAPTVDDVAAATMAATAAELRKPGDYVVHRFSGSFRKAPILITETVVAVHGALLIVDIHKGSDPDAAERLRVTFDRTPGAPHEVARVTRIRGDKEESATADDYEKLMAETIVVPERNEDTIGTEVVTASLGDQPIDCKRTSYRVVINKKKAVMSTLTNDSFAWGDVGGEIKTEDGKLIYRAEVVEMGSAQSKRKQAAR